MKTRLLTITAKLFFSLALLSACEQEIQEAAPVETVPATLKDLTGLDGCGWVFELQDGSKLEFVTPFFCGTPPLPETTYENPFENFEFVEGKQVRIAYEELEAMGSICMVGKVVRITKLQALD